MGAYEKFAQVYDLFMDNIDYEEWADYITDHLKKYGIEDGLVPVSYTHLTLPTKA